MIDTPQGILKGRVSKLTEENERLTKGGGQISQTTAVSGVSGAPPPSQPPPSSAVTAVYTGATITDTPQGAVVPPRDRHNTGMSH